MKLLNLWMPAFAICLAAGSAPAASHHSFAMFDQTKEVEIKGVTVTRFEWTNPHVFVIASNGSTTYTLECSSPNLMVHQGWAHNTIAPGARIDITFYPLRNGRPGGMLKTVVLPDGRVRDAW